MDHPDTPKLVNSILKALEILTKASSSIEQVFRADGGTQKRVTGGRGAEQRIPVVNEALDTDVRGAEGSQAQTSQQTQESLSQEALPHDATALLPVGSVDNHVEEQMEHDRADRGTSEEVLSGKQSCISCFLEGLLCIGDVWKARPLNVRRLLSCMSFPVHVSSLEDEILSHVVWFILMKT